jgi:multidrug efflux pump subunit AcrA (membrane-fusion protein)
MIPVTVAAKNLSVVPGSIVTLHLASSLPSGKTALVVPRTALVEEMGNYFVFVQQCVDSFEKREVKIGNSDGKYTQILSGLKNGENVVSQGAVSLKLSQGAGALDPHAGHVH